MNDPLPKQNTHSVIRTSTPQAKLSTKPTRTSVNNTHTMHVNDTITEHGRTLDGIKTTAGTSTQFSGSHPEQLPQMTIKLSVVFTHGTSVTRVFWARTVDGKPFVDATKITPTYII